MTDAAIAKLKLRNKRYAIGIARGLQLVVYPTGRRSWIFRYRFGGRSRSLRLGCFPSIKIDRARRLALKCGLMLAMDRDPGEAVRSARRNITVRELGARWVAEVVDKARKDPKAVTRYLGREVYPKFGARTMASITPWETQKLIFAKRDAGKPEAAAALRHMLKRLFDYAKACGVVATNPVELTPLRYVTQHKSRQRFLSEQELPVFFERLRRMARTGIALELMLLTLCRKSEMRLCRWEHINFEKAIWELPAELSKMKTAHIFYLSRQAVALFRRLKEMGGRAEVVLPMKDSLTEPIGAAVLNKAIARVKWGIPHFTPHDLRRTASTHLNELGYNPDWIEKALNHTPLGVRGTYNRAQFGTERRRMLQEWADWLDGLKGEC